MKSLNRTLSLVLVLVMVLGMFGIAGAAFTDTANIKYNEAVDVMTAIGVFNGMDDGSFKPTDNLTREQAAKILCYLTMGKAAADNLTTSAAPFNDVAAERWSAGSIAYCVQQGIIAGRGDGSFDPSANITGYEFAKMLLVALGYDPVIENFTGSSWSVNVAKRAFASTNKIFAGNETFNGNAPAKREEAALYSLNCMQAGLVTYATKGGDIKLPDGTVIHQPASAPAQNTGSFMNTFYPRLSLDKTVDDAGRVARKWTNGTTVIGIYADSSAIVSWSADHTAATDSTVAKALAGYTFATSAEGGVVSTNGTDVSTTLTADVIKGLTGNGVLVEVYATNKVVNRVVVTETTLATIINKDTVNKTVTVNDGVAQVTLSAKSSVEKFGNAYTALYNKNVNDKVLLVSKISGSTITNILSYADPTLISGQYTSYSAADETYTIGGKAYELNAAYALTTPSFTFGSTYSMFLDAYGYIIGVNTSATTTTYALMLQGSRDGSAMAGYTYNAQLLFADGSTKWVTISAYNGSAEATDLNTAAGLTNVFVGYTAKTDGSYVIASVTPATDTITGPKQITKDSSIFNSKLVSNSTVFLIYNSGTKTYDCYKGIKNVPTTVIPTDSNAYGLLNAGSTAYGMVVVKNATTTAADAVYVYNNTAIASNFVNGVQVDTYKAIVNGVIGTVNVRNGVTVNVGLTVGNTYANGVLVAFGSAPTSIAADAAAKSFNKSDDAGKAYTTTLSAKNVTLTDGILNVATTNGITGIVGENFVCYVVDTTATPTTCTVKSLGSTAFSATGDLEFVIDANGYVAYAVLTVS